MAWEHLDITRPHLVYAILGGFTTLFMLCSSFIKERMYIGEATVATLCGVIFGPHAANLINPNEWGSVDIVTVEFSRIVLVVQCFAVGVELPKYYMEKHWKSVVFLLVPVMTVGWLLVSLFIWWMIPALSWVESLVVSACVTATDPVLASSVVGKGKFAKRVPKHLRDLLSAESGCNDGMAFPFVYISLYLLQFKYDAADVSFHFIVYVVLYECIFGAFYGFMVGYIARHGIKYAERHEMIDRESLLVFYFVVALFCAGSGSILGVDDLLVGFAAGVGFSNDGWFGEKTEESHVSNVIDLLINLAYFVYFGTIIPWEQYNNGEFGVVAWRLVVVAVFVLLFRRIPIMLALKPFIPDVRNWREALFAGHFGPIGVGAIFVAILARAELEHEEPVPLSELPPEDAEHYALIYLVWPIVTFLVISSILVHGSSIAVFTLGKRINTLTLTMSYTAAPEDGPSWMNRLPRISSQSRSQARTMSEASFEDPKMPDFPPGTLAPPNQFLRRQKEDDQTSQVSKKRRHKHWDDGIGPGGPISQSAIFPNRNSPLNQSSTKDDDKDVNNEKESFPAYQETNDSTLAGDSPKEKSSDSDEGQGRGRDEQPSDPPDVEIYDEGNNMIVEDEQGEVLEEDRIDELGNDTEQPGVPATRMRSKSEGWRFGGLKRRVTDMYSSELEKRKEKDKSGRRHEPARAYQFGNSIIVEDEDGEVVKTYELPSQKPAKHMPDGSDLLGTSLKYIGLGALSRHPDKNTESAAEEGVAGPSEAGKTRPKPGRARRKTLAQQLEQEDDDRQIRFTIGGVGQRMTKADFIRQVQNLDEGTKKEVVEQSNAPSDLKKLAKQVSPTEPAKPAHPGIPRITHTGAESPQSASLSERAAGKRSESTSPDRRPGVTPAGQLQRPLGPSRLQPSEQQTETAVERKRRLAVLATQADDGDGASGSGVEAGEVETPAERRRREAALGAAEEESDSDDEGTPRVPPARRGIRFAEPSRK